MQPTIGPGIGDVLAGKYRVERVLGVGGMGVVVAAHHLQLDEKVAIKFLLPEMLSNPDAVGRFAREARAAVKIKSEHVARVLDVGTLETGAPYMVMEFLEGSDLGALLKQRGPLPIEQAVDFLLQASIAVAEAHSLGIVHRDLKPSNLYCVRAADGRLVIKVLDFGISKVTGIAGASPSSLTRTSAMMGSILYMSPEQMRSPKDVDARADIWSLGVVLYELLTADFPFMGETQAGVCIKIASEPPAPIERIRPDIAPGLRDVVLRCLQKDPAWRYPNVAALAADLAPFAPRGALGMIERIHAIAGGAWKGALGAPFSSPASNLAPITAGGQSALGPSQGTSSPMTRTAPTSMGGKMGAYGAAGALAVMVVVGLAALAVHAVRAPASGGTPAAGPASAVAIVPPPAPSATPSSAPPEPSPVAAPAAPIADVAASEHDAGPAAAPPRRTTPKPRPAGAGAPAAPPAAGEPANAPPADPLQNLNMKR